MKQWFTIVLCMCTLGLVAQVDIDHALQFKSATDSLNQLEQVGAPSALDHAINVLTYQNGTVVHATATGNDTLIVNFTPAPTAYAEGMKLFVSSTGNNSLAGHINVNGLGLVGIYKHATDTLDSLDIRAGKLLTIVYDGANFQLQNPATKACPNGFTSVNDDYCINTDDNGSVVTFWEAAAWCADQNAKLCSWGQWYYACQKSGLGLVNMTNNWEWIDAGQNHTDAAAMAGAGGNCQQEQSLSILSIGSNVFARCCYQK